MARRFVTMASAVLALLALAACSSTKKEDKPMELVKIHARFTPKEIWTIGLGYGQQKLLLGLAPGVDGNRVYAANAAGDVLALELASGRKVWRRRQKMPISG